jgi:hypothetical protein
MTTTDWRSHLGLKTGSMLGPPLEQFNTVADHIARTRGVGRARAGAMLDQALGFVHFAAQNPGNAYSPSPEVDKAWDDLVLHSIIYTRWCEASFGRYIHHTPIADPANPPPTIGGRALIRPADTAKLMAAAGYRVDPELWPDDAEPTSKANCTSCYSGDHTGDDEP